MSAAPHGRAGDEAWPAPPAPGGSTQPEAGDLSALARCVGDVRRFLDEHWDAAPLYRPGADPGGFADLLDVGDCDRILAQTGLRAPAFRLVKGGRSLPTGSVTRTARIGSRTVNDLVDVEAVLAEVDRGATLVLQGLQRSWPPVAALCDDLEASLTHPVQANAYLTPPTAAGLDVHADAHDVLVLHVHGRKQWVVYPEDGDSWDLALQPGDCLYLPRGTRHAARTTETPSLHLTVGIKALTWRDVARRALDASADPRLDWALPPGLATEPTTLVEAVRQRLPHLGQAVADADADAVADAVRTAARTRPSGRGRLRDLLEVDGVEDDTRLRRRPAATAEVSAGDDEVVLTLRDRRLRLPEWTGPAVAQVVQARELRPADLAEHLDAHSRLVLTRRLVREGLLAIVDGR